MLPPPPTTETCMPSETASAMDSATYCTISGSIPRPPPPANASPESLRMTRFQPESCMAGSVFVSSTSLRPPLSSPSGTGPPSSSDTVGPDCGTETRPDPPKVPGKLLPGTSIIPILLGLADLEAGEALDVHAGLVDDVLHRLLVLLDGGLAQQGDLLEETVEAALDDLRDGLLRLAFLTGGLLGDTALALDHVGGDLVLADVLGSHRGDLLGEVLADLLVRLVQQIAAKIGRAHV